MSAKKILLKDRVLTCGAGSRRAVLDYESSLVYQYDEPSNVLAYYEPSKGWIIRDKPYYSSGGWGNGSSGDAEGHYLISNAYSILEAIGATVYEINSLVFLSATELKELNRAISAHNKLAEKQVKIAQKLGEKNVEVSKLPELDGYKLRQMRKGISLKGDDAIKTASKFTDALNVFINRKGKTVTIGGYTISPNLVRQEKRTVAFRDGSDNVFMNSEVLNVTSFEREFLGNQSIIQKYVRQVSKYNIPFNVLESADLKLSETKVLEQGPESDHTVSGETRHFTGALLLENNGRKFLMDIDRREIGFGIFNAFFVETNSSVNSIAEAYDSMKPDAVRDAEKQGLEVERQGEWFFIPTDKVIQVPKTDIVEWSRDGRNGIVWKHEISHGKGRPNTLYKPVGFGDLDNLVCGTVRHSGREHKDLDLGQSKTTMQVDGKEVEAVKFKLWKVVGNTTVGNFTIKGDID